MRSTTTALALAIAMGLATASATSLAATPAATQISPGQQVRGEITSADLVNWRDGSRSELFNVTLEAGQGVRFVVEGPLRAQLSLYLDGQLVRASSGEDEAATLAVRATRAGRYVLAVSGSDASAYGPFTLASSALQVYAGGALASGATITDWLDGSKRIPLRIEREGLYVVRMASDEFDTVLAIEGNGVALGNDDANGSNSQLTAQLAAGDYTLVTSGYGGQAGGQYELSVAERELPAGVALAAGGDLVPGTDITALYQGQPVDYRLRVAERQLLALDMRSAELDANLQLTGEGITLVDDDGGERLDARLMTVLEPGEYTVRAAAFEASGGSGVFTLAARLSDLPANAGGGALQVGQARDAQLVPGMTDRYTFRIARAGAYVIEMTSSDGLDSRLALLQGTERVADDDDGGDNYDARIEQTLQPGDYVLEASSAMGPQGGSYRVQVQRR